MPDAVVNNVKEIRTLLETQDGCKKQELLTDFLYDSFLKMK